MTPRDYSPESFLRALSNIDRNRSSGEKFRDFLELAYCAYAKQTASSDEEADALEARYMRVVESYQNKDDVRAYPELLAMTVMGVQESLDYLGTVSSQLEILNPRQGQFFTPMLVCDMMALMLLGDLKPQLKKEAYLAFGEPAAGAGAMLLAARKVYKQQGINHNLHMFAYAADVSKLAYQMCYLQLSMAGIPAYVAHANSLSREHFEGAWTMAAYVFRAHHGHTHFDKPKAQPEESETAETPAPDFAPPTLRQLSMF